MISTDGTERIYRGFATSSAANGTAWGGVVVFSTGSNGATVSRDYDYLPYFRIYGNTAQLDFNFGSPAFTISSGNADANGHGNFEYAVPSGYFALCTKNLAEFG